MVTSRNFSHVRKDDMPIEQELSEAASDMEAVRCTLNDSSVRRYGLQAEIVTWALYAMRENPNLTVHEALSAAYWEWVK